jgi:hypothetical protein
VVVALLTLFALAGCGHGRSGAQAVTPPPADPTVLVLRIHEVPGMPAPTAAASVPEFSLYGGGLVVIPGDPAGAMQSARTFQLTDTAYRDIYRRAVAAGLDTARRIDRPTAPDAPTLTITLLSDGEPRTTVVTAPHGKDRDRDRIAEFRRSLQPFAQRREALVSGPSAYRPAKVAVIATWSAAAATAPAPDWPFEPLASGERVASGLCQTYTGERLDQLVRLAGGITPTTRFRSGDSLFYVVFRPLLPDESGCTGLNPR